MVERKRLAIGTAKFLSELNISTAELSVHADQLRSDGSTVIFVAINGKAAGIIGVADTIKQQHLLHWTHCGRKTFAL